LGNGKFESFSKSKSQKDGSIAGLKLGNEVIVDKTRKYLNTNLTKIDHPPVQLSDDTVRSILFGDGMVPASTFLSMRKDGFYTVDNAALQKVSEQMAEELSQVMGHVGKKQTQTSGHGSIEGGIGTPPMSPAQLKVGAGLGLRADNLEQYSYNLNYARARFGSLSATLKTMDHMRKIEPKLHERVEEELEKRGIYGARAIEEGKKLYEKLWNEEFAKTWRQNFNNWIQNMKKLAGETDAFAATRKDRDFGASAPAGELERYAQKLGVGGKWLSEKAEEWLKKQLKEQNEIARAIASPNGPDVDRIAKILGTDREGAERYLQALRGGGFNMVESYWILHGKDVEVPEGKIQKGEHPVETQKANQKNVVDLSAYADKLGMNKPEDQDKQ